MKIFKEIELSFESLKNFTDAQFIKKYHNYLIRKKNLIKTFRIPILWQNLNLKIFAPKIWSSWKSSLTNQFFILRKLRRSRFHKILFIDGEKSRNEIEFSRQKCNCTSWKSDRSVARFWQLSLRSQSLKVNFEEK